MAGFLLPDRLAALIDWLGHHIDQASLTVGTGALAAVASMAKLEPWIGGLQARPEQRLPTDREPAGAG